jgi:hypothetical protein
MTKDNNNYLQLEVLRDKTSGKLIIIAHFDSNAPNVHQDKDGYYWMPTYEEKDFINEAFELIPINRGIISSEKTRTKPEIIEEKPNPRAEKPSTETQPQVETIKHVKLPTLEDSREKDIFEATDEQIKRDDLEKDEDKKIQGVPFKTEEENPEKSASDMGETEIKVEEGTIVKADDSAMENAIKKHTENDKSIVEADEQTIIDKVLSQKKKGKWSNR